MSSGSSATSFSATLNLVLPAANGTLCLSKENSNTKILMQKVQDFVFSRWGLGLAALTISSYVCFNFIVALGTFTSLAFIFALYVNNASFSFNTLHFALHSAKNLGWQDLATKILVKMKQINPSEIRLRELFINAAKSNDIQMINIFTRAYDEAIPLDWLEIALLNASRNGNIEIIRLLFHDTNIRRISSNSLAGIIFSANNIETGAKISALIIKSSLPYR